MIDMVTTQGTVQDILFAKQIKVEHNGCCLCIYIYRPTLENKPTSLFQMKLLQVVPFSQKYIHLFMLQYMLLC